MTATPQPSKPLPKWQQKILTGIWEDLKPKVAAAAEAAKAKLLAALAGQPLVVIGTVVAAIDAFLLKGPQPLPAGPTKLLTAARTLIVRLLEPPKPISTKLRRVLAGIVTLAGALGIWTRVKPITKS